MLVQFSFSNFKCFKDETVLNLTTSRKKNKEFYSIDTRFNYRVLKTMAVYGANASGKSKLFDAIAFLKMLLSNSKMQDGDFLWKKMYDNFRLSTETRDNSSNFEIIFIIDDIQYRYGIELTKERIISEYLFTKENKRETEVFQRANNKIVGKDKLGKIGKNLIENNMIRYDMPFLSALYEWNDTMAAKIFQWFQSVTIISGNELPPIPLKYLEDQTSKNILLSFLKTFDINIEDISLHEVSITDIPEKIKKIIGENNLNNLTIHNGLKTSHKVFDEHYSVAEMCYFQMEKDESYGTNRLARLFAPFFSSSVIIVDEFDSGIHPNILNVLISMFYNFKNKNKQLIINTHNSSLLSRNIDYDLLPDDGFELGNDIDIDALLANPNNITFKHPRSNKQKLFIKDQIYFVTKNRYGVASLVPLTDYKNIRSDVEQLYLEGLLDGTPNIRRYQIPTLLSKEDERWENN